MAFFKKKKKTEEDSKQAENKDVKEEKKEEKGKTEEKKKEEGKSMKDLYKSRPDSSSGKESEKSSAKKETQKDVQKEKKEEKKEESLSTYPRAYKILLKPLVTEKISNLGAQNKYAFQVALGANKVEVSKAIKGVYGVEPEKVNIIRMEGKRVRVGMIRGKRKDWKKAIITLPKGKTINVYEGI